jgi:hypothetical protein
MDAPTLSRSLEVGSKIILKMAWTLNHPTPAFSSAKDSRKMTMHRLLADAWNIDEVSSGKCGSQIKRCWDDVITSVGHPSEVEMKEQITIRMKNIVPGPPHYPTQGS